MLWNDLEDSNVLLQMTSNKVGTGMIFTKGQLDLDSQRFFSVVRVAAVVIRDDMPFIVPQETAHL